MLDELLDLMATEKGFGAAMYAREGEDPGCASCSGLCTTIILCHICWSTEP